MSKNKPDTTAKAHKESHANIALFNKENYKWMLIGLAVLAIGFFLMAGGKSSNPQVFDPKEVYSPVRITLAPLLIIIGFVIEIYAIMKKTKTDWFFIHTYLAGLIIWK